MKKTWQIITIMLSHILVAALAAAAALFLFAEEIGVTSRDGYSKLDQLSDLIEERFIGEADRTDYEDAAAAAMVAALGDEWSYYIPAGQYESHLESVNNAYVGIGITITVHEEGIGFHVTKVNPGGPADEAGMKPGDVIIGIEGQSAAGLTAEEARDRVRGEVDTQVALTILREGRELEMSVTRREVLSPVAAGQMLDAKIGLVTIYNFDARCYDETSAAIDALLKEGATALIFDVRNNPGGYKHELVDILDDLLPAGPLFRSEFYTGEVSVDKSDAACLDIPMAVLVNEDSFSAAEFFAAALSEYDAAIVVGQQTYGKGYFQTTIPLNDGSAVGLSVGRYTTPNGVSLAGVGVTPDVIVDVDDETYMKIYAGILAPEEDPQIQAAVNALKK